MSRIHTLVIGAGQAGLAMSRCLAAADIEHVVLERGVLAERWRTQTWESLQLLTPNWATRLPGWRYRGPHPDGYMSASELADYLSAYATAFDAPVHERSAVRSLAPADNGYVVRTAHGTWHARSVVLATGWCDRPHVPSAASELDGAIAQVTPSSYRSPQHLPDGGVLVVGASATGAQIADELARSGRQVTLAVGRHHRLPRRYRGLDSWWWLDQIGMFAETIDGTSDHASARDAGSLQLIGRPDHRDVDLATLQALGVQLAGRLVDVNGTRVRFAPDLPATTTAADAGLEQILARIDRHILAAGLDREVPAATPLRRVVRDTPIRQLELRRERITTVVWATGFTRSYPWLRAPVLDEQGEIIQRRGVTPLPGLYVLGQRFQHRRDANFIDGVRHDAAFVAHQIAITLRPHQRVAP